MDDPFGRTWVTVEENTRKRGADAGGGAAAKHRKIRDPELAAAHMTC